MIIMKNKLNKKGFMKTLEALLAAMIILVFVAYIIPANTTTQTQDPSGVLRSLSQNEDFRNCVVTYNMSCVNDLINQTILPEYQSNYVFLVTKDPTQIPNGIPNQKVISESTYIATDGTIHNEYIVRLYYWADSS